jgi:hypothetical protein
VNLAQLIEIYNLYAEVRFRTSKTPLFIVKTEISSYYATRQKKIQILITNFDNDVIMTFIYNFFFKI